MGYDPNEYERQAAASHGGPCEICAHGAEADRENDAEDMVRTLTPNEEEARDISRALGKLRPLGDPTLLEDRERAALVAYVERLQKKIEALPQPSCPDPSKHRPLLPVSVVDGRLLGTLVNVYDDLRDIIEGEYGRPYEVKREIRLVLADVRRMLTRAGIERDD